MYVERKFFYYYSLPALFSRNVILEVHTNRNSYIRFIVKWTNFVVWISAVVNRSPLLKLPFIVFLLPDVT